jgi:hypothetical protein
MAEKHPDRLPSRVSIVPDARLVSIPHNVIIAARPDVPSNFKASDSVLTGTAANHNTYGDGRTKEHYLQLMEYLGDPEKFPPPEVSHGH